MGMTVEEIKEEIRSDLTSKKMTGDSYSESFRDALANLLIIAEKYQKIQAIAEKCNLKLLPKEAMSTFMKDVLEVLEDGRN